MTVNKTCTEILDEYINLIKDEKLKSIARIICYNEYSLAVFEKPSSSSGRYHPAEENASYGQLMHTLKTVCLALIGSRRTKINDINYIDAIIISALIHDIPYKYSIDPNTGLFRCNLDHAVKNAIFFENVADSQQLNNQVKREISMAISYHMGRFNNYNNSYYSDKHPSLLGTILHDADYFSSRDNIMLTDYSANYCKKIIDEMLQEK